MHNGIRQIFGQSRKQVEDAIRLYTEINDGKVSLSKKDDDTYSYFRLDDSIKAVLTIFPISICAKGLPTEVSQLRYKYQYGYGFNPSMLYDAETAIDDMSMDEIYELIKRM